MDFRDVIKNFSIPNILIQNILSLQLDIYDNDEIERKIIINVVMNTLTHTHAILNQDSCVLFT